MGLTPSEARPRGSEAAGDGLGTVVIWFTAAFLLLTVLLLAPTVLEATRFLSRSETAGISAGTLAILCMPSVAALTIPFALLLGPTIGLSRSRTGSARWNESARLVRIVTAFVLPVCLLEGVLLAGIVPVANDHLRRALFAGVSGRDSASGSLPKGVREMSLFELRQVAAARPGLDLDHRSATFELHKRISIPVAGLFLAFLGMALGASRRHGRAMARSVFAGAAGLLWYALLVLGASMVPAEQIPPWFGAWLPAIAAFCLATLAWWRDGTPSPSSA